MDEHSTNEPSVARRRLSFSLRALFAMVALIAAFCSGWTANELKRQRQSRDLASQVDAEVKQLSQRLRPIMNDIRVATDKLARAPLSSLGAK